MRDVEKWRHNSTRNKKEEEILFLFVLIKINLKSNIFRSFRLSRFFIMRKVVVVVVVVWKIG